MKWLYNVLSRDAPILASVLCISVPQPTCKEVFTSVLCISVPQPTCKDVFITKQMMKALPYGLYFS